MPKVIAIGTFKGGVGKTMTTFNLAGILAENNYKVLCIDVDPQGNLTSNLGVNRANQGLIGVEAIFSENSSVNFNDIVIRKPIAELPTLDLLPSTVLLHKSELFMALAPARELKLKYFMLDNKDELDNYDYILIDTNPSMGYLNQNAFVVSDKIIMPATADLSDLDGIHLFCALWDDLREKLRIEDNIAAVVTTKNDKRVSLDRSFIDHIRSTEDNEDIAELLVDTIIPVNITLKEAAMSCLPINLYKKDCVGYKAYKSLVDELFERGVF